MELLLEIAEARVAVGDLQGTTAALDAADESASDPRASMHVDVDRLYYQSLVDPDVDLDDLTQTADRAIAVFEGAGDEAGLAKTWRLLAEGH